MITIDTVLVGKTVNNADQNLLVDKKYPPKPPTRDVRIIVSKNPRQKSATDCFIFVQVNVFDDVQQSKSHLNVAV
jgi:hypothetical protein